MERIQVQGPRYRSQRSDFQALRGHHISPRMSLSNVAVLPDTTSPAPRKARPPRSPIGTVLSAGGTFVVVTGIIFGTTYAVVNVQQGKQWIESRALGMTPQQRLLGGAMNRDLAAVRDALDAGADPNSADSVGITPLMSAAQCPDDTIARLLLAHGADLDTLDHAHRTALMWAVRSDRDDMVCLLLDAGADPSLHDRAGNTAADIARERGDTDIAAVLDERLADQ